MGGNVIIDINTLHHSNQLKFLICHTGHFDVTTTVEIGSVAICVRSSDLKTLLIGLSCLQCVLALQTISVDSIMCTHGLSNIGLH